MGRGLSALTDSHLWAAKLHLSSVAKGQRASVNYSLTSYHPRALCPSLTVFRIRYLIWLVLTMHMYQHAMLLGAKTVQLKSSFRERERERVNEKGYMLDIKD